MTVTTILIKSKDKSERFRLDSRTFYDKPGTVSKKTVSGNFHIGKERIGLPIDKISISIKSIVEDETIGGIKIGSVTILGNPKENNVDSFRYGKDVKSVKNLLSDKLTLNITLGRENDITSDDHIDHSFEVTSYGQNSLFKTYDYVNRKIIPFDDINGNPSFESYIGKEDKDKTGYPYVYNGRRNYFKFRDPDPASLDGAVEVFHVRSSPVNTGFLDLQIKGARGLFGVGNWELTQHLTYGKKGSPLVSEVYEVKQSSYDFFEDAAESILSKPVDGFVSEGLYKLAPFVDKDKLANMYTHITSEEKNNLLSNSMRNDSEIGTRFKSRENGFIITPFYQLVEQRSFGTDSIAFSGLLKG